MVDIIDFDDLPEDEVDSGEKMINVTFEVGEDIREMLGKIAKRERRTIKVLGGMILSDYVEQYVKDYQAGKKTPT